MRPELIRFTAALAFLVGGTLFPASASRAGLGAYFTGNTCTTLDEVAAAYDFRESFVGLAKCESLCKQAAASCTRSVKASYACQLAFASDWVAFDSAVECAGLKGADLKDCKSSAAAELKAWRKQIKENRDFALIQTCDAFLNAPNSGCLRACSGI
jgi:hypothetical protein